MMKQRNQQDPHQKQRQLHKFGGSSLANSNCYQRVASIMAEYSLPDDLMVVSAAGNTTNQLIEWVESSQKENSVIPLLQQELLIYQTELITQLLAGKESKLLIALFRQDLDHITRLLHGEITESVFAEIVGHGEIWSARLMAALLNHRGIDSLMIDARDFLRAERSAQPEVDVILSAPLLEKVLLQYPNKRLVITGFICRNQAGESVLLGRNGSDYSATQIGALINAGQVTIWSDVAGVYSADPRIVNDACLLPLLRLDEASELARLAAPVLHSRTLQPVSNSDIDLRLRSSIQRDQGSTRIERILASGHGAKIVTSHENVCLIELKVTNGESAGEFYQNLTLLLNKEQIMPLATGLHNDKNLIQLCYTTELVSKAWQILLSFPLPCEYQKRAGLVLIAMVGADVCNSALHCHRFYQQFKQLPVEFMWHSDEGISVAAVLRSADTNTLVQQLHQSLFQAKKRVGIVLFGKGNIGSRWLKLFATEQQGIVSRTGLEFYLIGMIDSQKMLLDFNGLSVENSLSLFDKNAQPYQISLATEKLREHPFDDLVVVDITASEVVAKCYLDFARYGFHVISANKIAGASESHKYHQLRDAFNKTGRHWLYNATVGAGLPINHTVRDLIYSGDTILALSGIFSGTLSWLFQQYDNSVPFSALVEQAWQQGLTEPDPRSDLSGLDVMRKLVILVREAGYDIEPKQIQVESLVPASLTEKSVDDFFEHAQVLDEDIARRFNMAKKENKVLRYVARFDLNGNAKVGLEMFNLDDPLASLKPCDNVFIIESRWYRDNPLIIRGPGAGREVTAGAIQSDLNRLARLL